MHARRLTRFLKVIFTLLLFQVGETWYQNEIKVKTVCKGDKIFKKL